MNQKLRLTFEGFAFGGHMKANETLLIYKQLLLAHFSGLLFRYVEAGPADPHRQTGVVTLWRTPVAKGRHYNILGNVRTCLLEARHVQLGSMINTHMRCVNVQLTQI